MEGGAARAAEAWARLEAGPLPRCAEAPGVLRRFCCRWAFPGGVRQEPLGYLQHSRPAGPQLGGLSRLCPQGCSSLASTAAPSPPGTALQALVQPRGPPRSGQAWLPFPPAAQTAPDNSQPHLTGALIARTPGPSREGRAGLDPCPSLRARPLDSLLHIKTGVATAGPLHACFWKPSSPVCPAWLFSGCCQTVVFASTATCGQPCPAPLV